VRFVHVQACALAGRSAATAWYLNGYGFATVGPVRGVETSAVVSRSSGSERVIGPTGGRAVFEGEAIAITGLIIDIGALVDTAAADRQAWWEEFDRAGVVLTGPGYAQIWNGWGLNGHYSILQELAQHARKLGAPFDYELTAGRQRARYRQLRAGLPPRPGIVDWLSEAEHLGLAVAVVAGDDPGWAQAHLDRLGLARFVRTVVTADPEETIELRPEGLSGPDPVLHRRALKEFGLKAADAVAIEYSAFGAYAAQGAGLQAMCCPTPLVSARTDLSGADLIVWNITATTLAASLHALAESPRGAAREFDPQRWDSVHAFAGEILRQAPGVGSFVGDDQERRSRIETAAADIIAVLLYEWAVVDGGGDQPMPWRLLHDRLHNNGLQVALIALGLTGAAPSLNSWNGGLGDGRQIHLMYRPGQLDCSAARDAVDTRILRELGGIRLDDQILAPVTDNPDLLIPASVGYLVDWRDRDDALPEITVTVTASQYNLYGVLVSSDRVLLDVTGEAADTDGRLGRGTLEHATQCLIADLRRAAIHLGGGNEQATVVTEMLQRLPRYRLHPSLSEEMINAIDGLFLTEDPDQEPGREVLTGLATGRKPGDWFVCTDYVGTRELRDPAAAAVLLNEQTDRLQQPR
jgi:beta-phosphoglucomutase-like phosphatase (HAD superfamily)